MKQRILGYRTPPCHRRQVIHRVTADRSYTVPQATGHTPCHRRPVIHRVIGNRSYTVSQATGHTPCDRRPVIPHVTSDRSYTVSQATSHTPCHRRPVIHRVTGDRSYPMSQATSHTPCHRRPVIHRVIVIVITTYHAVYWSYRASRTDRWFLPRSIPRVPGLLEVAHSLTEDPEDRGYQPTRLWGQWQLQSVSISNGDKRGPVGPPGVKGQGMATQQHSKKHKKKGCLLWVQCSNQETKQHACGEARAGPVSESTPGIL